jgi:hypothetical protein
MPVFGLTSLGAFHTAISLAALVAAVLCYWRYGRIAPGSAAGKFYIVMTVASCVTGLGIFQHGGFGKPHALALITLGTLLVAAAAGAGWFGRFAREVETVSYSATVLFHLIPGITETSTRLPPGAPLVANAEAPELVAATGVLLVLFVIGATVQVRRLRAQRR